MTDPGSSENRESITFLGDFSKKLVANTLFNFIGRFWSFFATFLLTPFILRHLSVAEFGVWVVLSVFINSLILLDFGLGAAFVKFISAYNTHQDYDKINKVLFSGLVFYGLLGIVLIGCGLAVEKPLFDLFRITDASTAYLFILLASALGNIASMLLSVFRGIQRMDKSNAIEMTMSLVNVAGTVIVLEAGLGLSGLALNALCNASIAVVGSWWALRRTVPRISLGFHFDGKLLREMFAYGAQILVSRIGGIVCFQLDKLIVARFVGVASVSFYEVGARLAAWMRVIPLLMMSALIPATSELGARNEKDKILRTYVIASKYVAMMTVALVGFVVVEAESILNLWVGRGFEQSVILIQILAIGYGANVLGGAASQTGAGVGRPEFDMRSTVLLSVLSPILGLFLVQRFGAAGAAAGTSFALIAAAAYLLFAFHHNYVETSVAGTFREIHLRPLTAGILASAAVVGFHHALPAVGWLSQTRYLIPLKLVLDFAIFSPIYILFLIAARQVTAIDWRNFLGLMTFGFEFVRHPFRERVKIYR
jgi:O-antigen/teichoic acid export membrane protein